MTPADVGEAAFEAERARLLGLAYRILGSLVDAEDTVQNAWLRWGAADRDVIERPAAWLTTVTTRLALDQLKAARRRRETYVGPWLPEPILTARGPELTVEAAETLTLGFLAALEQLDPVSRVVFLLIDVFGYPSKDVAATVGKTPAACRQIAVRARRKLRASGVAPSGAPDRGAFGRAAVDPAVVDRQPSGGLVGARCTRCVSPRCAIRAGRSPTIAQRRQVGRYDRALSPEEMPGICDRRSPAG